MLTNTEAAAIAHQVSGQFEVSSTLPFVERVPSLEILVLQDTIRRDTGRNPLDITNVFSEVVIQFSPRWPRLRILSLDAWRGLSGSSIMAHGHSWKWEAASSLPTSYASTCILSKRIEKGCHGSKCSPACVYSADSKHVNTKIHHCNLFIEFALGDY